jgi:hypothetical protein
MILVMGHSITDQQFAHSRHEGHEPGILTSETSMRRPFEHTMTSAERLGISRGLLVISALGAALTLVVVGFVTANHYRAIATADGTAARSSGSSKDPGCPGAGQTGNAVCTSRNPESRR